MQVTFLYKAVRGMALRSYGLNVAKLAKLPDDLLLNAHKKSQQLERILDRKLENIASQVSGSIAAASNEHFPWLELGACWAKFFKGTCLEEVANDFGPCSAKQRRCDCKASRSPRLGLQRASLMLAS